MTEYSSAYYDACESWIEEVSRTNAVSTSTPVLTGRLCPPAPSEHIDPRMALTLADMPSLPWSGALLPLVVKRTHKSQAEQEKAK